MSSYDLFEKLKQPPENERFCVNCKNNRPKQKKGFLVKSCVKNTRMNTWFNTEKGCIAYYDIEFADLKLVNLADQSPDIATMWQRHWEWNGK